MKKMLLGLIAVTVMTVSLAAWAADEQTTETKDQTAAQQARPRTNPNRPIITNMDAQEQRVRQDIRGRGPWQDPATRAQAAGSAQEMYQSAQQRRQQLHDEAVKELEELKKLAESENATKTAAAIQKMIDKRNEEYKKQTEESDRRRAQFTELMRQRQQQGTAGQQQAQGQNRPGRTRQAGQTATTPATENTTKTDSAAKTENTIN
ncbi:MAG: hypothetical protein JXB18_14655 [Sedimentisphaerales bacterium]|nr:hypothetical protein [Sedimentisphaerales bacterium]